MTIIRCPRCRDEVTAPAKASRLAIVRCPLCLEEYPLADALRHAPPELIVVGGAAEASPAYAEAEAATAAPDYQVSGGGGVFDASPGAGAAMPVTQVKGARPRRKQGGGLGTLVGIVFGGVAGISLAVLLLWWVFDRDPLNVGPMVAKIEYIKTIVPEKFRGEKTTSGGTAPQSGATQPASSTVGGQPSKPTPQPRPGATPPASGGGLQTFPEPGAFAGPDNANAVVPAANVGLELPPETPKPPAGNVDLSALDPNAPVTPPPTGNAAGTEKPQTPDLTNLIPASVPPAPAVAPASAAPPTADDFKQAVLTAGDALVRYDASSGDNDPEARKAKFTEMYLAIAEMGRAITFLSLNDSDIEGMVKEMQILLNKLAGVGGSNKLSGVRFLAATNWTERKHGEGLLVAGHVKDFKAIGPLFEVTLDATRGNPLSIPMICDKNPQDFCQLEDELVVVGRIIDDPKTNLPGYEGAQPRVLMLGYCVKAPKTQ